MDWGSPIFVIVIIAMVMVTAIITTWMQSRVAARTAASDGEAELNRENARLAQENEALRRSMRGLEDRIGVLERIATDPAERTAKEIEHLR
jgi:cell division protein FtsB